VLSTDAGPLEVVWSKPHQHRWIVRFAGVEGREGADALRGTVLRAEPVSDGDDLDALWAHEVIGRRVVDQHGTDHGRVESLQANPASDLLVLESGALVPLRFVVAHDDRDTLVVDVPAGLLDETE
jgi:16S rRNA processing protein RimM